jgi:hypothetical protein
MKRNLRRKALRAVAPRSMTIESMLDMPHLRWCPPNPTSIESRYTAYLLDESGEVVEELDVNATTTSEALRFAVLIVDLDYKPGVEIMSLEREGEEVWAA